MFGFEDVRLDISDEDFTHLVFNTDLRSAAIVPEPSSVMLMMAGMLGITGMAIRRRNRSA